MISFYNTIERNSTIFSQTLNLKICLLFCLLVMNLDHFCFKLTTFVEFFQNTQQKLKPSRQTLLSSLRMLDKSRVIEILVSGVVMPGWTLLMQGAIAYILQGESDSPCRGERFALDKGVSDSPRGSECIALVFWNAHNLS